jgi:hypothetical protein
MTDHARLTLAAIKTMPKSLRHAINEVVLQHITAKLQRCERVDVASLTREIAQSLLDILLDQEEKHQGPLLAQVIGDMMDDYLRRSGQSQSGRRDN